MDDLTRKFLEDLDTRVRSSSTTTTAPPSPNPNINAAIQQSNQEGSLWDVIGTEQSPDWLTSPEKKGGMLNAVGALVWHGVDTALLGIPGYALGEEAPYQWEELGAGAKAGAVFGEAIGFFAPLGVISKGTKLVAQGAKAVGKGEKIARGSRRIVGKSIEDSLKYAPSGVDKAALRSSLKKSFGKQAVKREVSKYSLSPKTIAAAEEELTKQLAGGLAKAFPTMSAGNMADIIGAVNNGLRSQGRHINSIADYVEAALRTTFKTADKNKIVTYAAKASELTTNFALYNILTDGVGAMYGENEFDPASDVGHALLFSIGLPAIEHIKTFGGGIGAKGGRLPIISTIKRINKTISKLDGIKGEYAKMAEQPNGKETLNGLLRIITQNNYLKDSAFGRAVADGGGLDGNLSGKDAAKLLEEVIGSGSYKNIWRDFRKAAVKDLAGSLPRMVAGALYFNSHTILDFNMLKNVDPEILGAHMLVGMFFTRHRKALWDNEYKTIDRFDSKLALLDVLNLDATEIKSFSQYIDANMKAGLSSVGILENQQAGQLHRLFYNKENESQTKNVYKKMAPDLLNTSEFEIVRQAHDDAIIYQMALDAKNDVPFEEQGIHKVDLKSLSKQELYKIKTGLEEIVIDTDMNEKLSAENFTNWSTKLHHSFINEPFKRYISSMLVFARQMGVEVFRTGKEIDIDNPIGIADIVGLDRVEGLEYVKAYQNLITWMKRQKLVDDVEQAKPITAQELKSREDIQEINERIKDRFDSISKTLLEQSYGEGKVFFIDPVDPQNNGWLMAMGMYKRQQILNKFWNVLDGRDQTDSSINNIRSVLQNTFGTNVPSRLVDIKQLLRIRREKDKDNPDYMKSEAWRRLKASGEFQDAFDMLSRVIRFWSLQGESMSADRIIDNKTGKDITYNEALRILSEIGPQEVSQIIDDGFFSQMNTHYMRRSLNTSLLGARELSLLQLYKESGIGESVRKADGSWVWKIPTMEGLKEQLMDNEGLSSDAAGEKVKQYKDILNVIERIKGPNLIISKMTDLGSLDGSVTDFINEAWTLTHKFQETMLSDIMKVEQKGLISEEIVRDTRKLLDVLYDKDGIPKQISLEEQKDVLIWIEETLPTIKEQKYEKQFVDGKEVSFVELLENLRTKLELESEELADLADYESAIQKLSMMMQGTDKRNWRLSKTIESLMFRLSATPGDRVQSRMNRDNLIRTLVKEISKVEPDIGKEIEVDAAYEKFLDHPEKLGFDKFIHFVGSHVQAMRRAYTHEEYQIFMKANQEWYDSSMGHSADTPVYTPHWLELQYGEHNKQLKGDAFQSNLTSIRAEILKATNENTWPSIKGERGSTPAGHIANVVNEILVENVNAALKEKYIKSRSKRDSAMFEFNEKALPAILGQLLGTERMRFASLEEGSRGPHWVYEIGLENRGAAWEAAEEFAKPKRIKIYDVVVDMYEHNTLLDEQKNPDFRDIWVVDNISEAKKQIKAIKNGPGPYAGANLSDTPTKISDGHWIINHKKGDHKYVYTKKAFFDGYYKGTSLRDESSRDGKGRVKGGVYEKGEMEPIFLYKQKKKGVHNGEAVDNVNLIDDILEITNQTNDRKSHILNENGIRSNDKKDNPFEIIPPQRVVRFHTSFNNTFLVDTTDFSKDGRLNKRFDIWYEEMLDYIDSHKAAWLKKERTKIRNHFEILFKDYYNKLKLADDGSIISGVIDTAPRVVQAMRAMYWSRISKKGFIEFLLKSDDQPSLNTAVESWFKYFANAESTGAKMKGNRLLLEVLLKGNDRKHGDWAQLERPVVRSINRYLERGHFRSLSIGDESLSKEPLAAKSISTNMLNNLIGSGKKYGENSEMAKHIKNQIDNIIPRLLSLDNPSIDGVTYIGHDAARILFLHKGRTLYDTSAGVKPSVHRESDIGTILMKTNFVYDKKIADAMEEIGLDILTTESAAKSWDKAQASLKPGIQPKDFNEFVDAINISKDHLKTFDKSEIELEDISLGRNEDRHRLVTVSYALTDMMNEAGYDSFINTFVDYKTRMEASLSAYSSLNLGNENRSAVTASLIEELKEDGSIYEDGNQGTLRRLLSVGADPDSGFIRDAALDIAFKKIINFASKPQNETGGYSVLKPYLEGSIPVDAVNKHGHPVRLEYGGKKNSYYDGVQSPRSWNDLSFIFNFVDQNGEGRDIQILRGSKGEFVFVDNAETGVGGNQERMFRNDKLMNYLVGAPETLGGQRIWKKGKFGGVMGKLLRKLQEENDRMPTMEEIHNAFMHLAGPHIPETLLPSSERRSNEIGPDVLVKSFGSGKNKKTYEMRLHLHSLSLRVPNMKGDVAVHKVEGFYQKGEGNFVGINVYDLATIHQGDFDVDSAISYPSTPKEMNMAVSEMLGMNIDAFVYEKGQFSDIDIWGNGHSITKPAGSLNVVDPMEEHIRNFENSKTIFGQVMNIKSNLGIIERFDNMNPKESIIKDVDIMKMSRYKDVANEDWAFNEDYSKWRQRYGNVLQSIIDATKKPNFISAARAEDVMRFVLFGEPFKGSDIIIDELAKYQEDGFVPMFNIRHRADKLLMQDAIMTFIQSSGLPNRMLTGVFDAAGRRPADLNETLGIYNDYNRFLKDPNKFVFRKLLWRYRNDDAMRSKAINLFYNDANFTNKQKLAKSLLYKNKDVKGVLQTPDNELFNRFWSVDEAGLETAIKKSVGGNILHEIKSKAGVGHKLDTIKKARAEEYETILNKLEEMEDVFLITGRDASESIRELMKEESEKYDKKTGKIKEGSEESYDFTTWLYDKFSGISTNKVRDYSIIEHVLGSQSSSLRKFIKKNEFTRGAEESVGNARYRLDLNNNISQWMSEMKYKTVSRGLIGEKSQYGNGLGRIGKNHEKDFDIVSWDTTTNRYKKRNKAMWKNTSKKNQYIYTTNISPHDSSKVSIRLASVVKPGQEGWVDTNKRYVVVKNPLERTLMSDRQVQDAYSMLEVVGKVTADTIPGMSHDLVERFVNDVLTLNSEMREITTGVYDMNKVIGDKKAKSYYTGKNWMTASKKENVLLETFFDKWEDLISKEGLAEDTIGGIASYLLKPNPVEASVYTRGKEDKPMVQLPAFKMNNRISKAVERWLFDNGHHEVYESIFRKYGDVYRRRMNDVLEPEHELMYASDLYVDKNRSDYSIRDPLFDFAYGREFLYIPHILHRVRNPLKRLSGIVRAAKDLEGNIKRIVDYESPRDLHMTLDWFESSDAYTTKDIKEMTKCG